MATTSILIVDRSLDRAHHLEQGVRGLGYAVCGVATCGTEAVALAGAGGADLVLIDAALQGEVSGADAAAQIGARLAIPVVFVVDSAAGDESAAPDLHRQAASRPSGYVLRPVQWRQLDLIIRTALAARARERELTAERRALRHRLDRLQELNRQLESGFDCLDDAVILFDRERRPLFPNAAARLLCGDAILNPDADRWLDEYELFEVDGTTPVDLEEGPLRKALRSTQAVTADMFVRRRNRPGGAYVNVTAKPLGDHPDGPRGGMLVIREVTRHRERDAQLHDTLAELREQNELIDAAFKSISDGIVVANAEGMFLYVNPAAEQIVGMGLTDAPQEQWSQRYGAYYPDRVTPMPSEDLPLLRAIRRRESVDEEDLFIRNPGRPDGVYVRVSARPLLNDVGGVRGGVIVFRDVTVRRFAEEALTNAFAEGRSEVLDTLVHNIGNAITSVTTGVETLRRTLANDPLQRSLAGLAAVLDEHRDHWLEFLRDDARGRQVLPSILSLAAHYETRGRALMKTIQRVRNRAWRIADVIRTQREVDSAGMDRSNVDLKGALRNAVRVVSESLDRARVRTTVDCRGAPREIRIRESRFHQALVNLIKNAVEAIDDRGATDGRAPAPRIRICAWSGDRYLNLEVADNGIGIPSTDSSLLFAPGYTTKRNGSGLGLHSVANFVIGSGGRIQALSDGAGKGTTMRVMLPLSSVLVAAPPAPASAGRNGPARERS
ncbi:MAG: ATP-binding protein [Spirochaetaceae bacterium]|nr:ATP-binding protein [Spirochaetaceae bacterium]